jgi:hypothetical protein
MVRNERYSFVMLVVISIILSVLSFLGGLYEQGQNNHRFCQVIHSATTEPIPKPTDPKKNPSREQNYEAYIQFVQLGKSLGCGGTQSGVQQ